MSGICCFLCDNKNAPFPLDEEEEEDIPLFMQAAAVPAREEADEKNLTREEVGTRITQAVSEHLLPPLANLVKGYALPIVSDNLQFPPDDTWIEMKEVENKLRSICADLKKAFSNGKNSDEDNCLGREMIDALFRLTVFQYSNIARSERLSREFRIPEWEAFLISDVRNHVNGSVTKKLKKYFQEIVDDCAKSSQENADSVFSLLRKFVERDFFVGEQSEQRRKRLSAVRGKGQVIVAFYCYRESGSEKFQDDLRDLFREFVADKRVIIPQAMLDRCGGELGDEPLS